jgi:hypothetical protein
VLEAGDLLEFVLFSFIGIWMISVLGQPLLQDFDRISWEASTCLATSPFFH